MSRVVRLLLIVFLASSASGCGDPVTTRATLADQAAIETVAAVVRNDARTLDYYLDPSISSGIVDALRSELSTQAVGDPIAYESDAKETVVSMPDETTVRVTQSRTVPPSDWSVDVGLRWRDDGSFFGQFPAGAFGNHFQDASRM